MGRRGTRRPIVVAFGPSARVVLWDAEMTEQRLEWPSLPTRERPQQDASVVVTTTVEYVWPRSYHRLRQPSMGLVRLGACCELEKDRPAAELPRLRCAEERQLRRWSGDAWRTSTLCWMAGRGLE